MPKGVNNIEVARVNRAKVLEALVKNADLDGIAIVSQTQVALDLGLSLNTVARAVAALKKSGQIVDQGCAPVRGGLRIYKIPG